MDIYQMVYNDGEALTFGGHLISLCFNVSLCFCSYIFGMFFTLLFWKLKKVGAVIAIIVMLLTINLILGAVPVAIGLSWTSSLTQSFIDAVAQGPGALMIFFLINAAIFAVIEWLLLRRIFLRAAK